jgi:lysophospholipase L1-like esterase
MKKFLVFLVLFVLLTSWSYTPPRRVLYIGDSLTCAAGGWQDQVSKHFGYQSLNLAKGGVRTDYMRTTMNACFKKDSAFSKVFIYGGCNDAFSMVDLQGAVNNIQMMVDSCNRRGIEPIVIVGFNPAQVTTKTVYDAETTKRCVGRYIEFQKLMVKEKTGLKNCKIIPMDTTMFYSDTWDGIHFAPSGHKKFSTWVINNMEK